MSEELFLHNSEDPEMRSAAKLAQSTFKYFWREMSWEARRIVPGVEVSALKFPFSDPGDDTVEQMWISDAAFDGETIKGTLMNQPQSLKTFREQDQVSRPLSELSDWLYASMGDVCGGYSIDVMRKRMPAKTRKQHDSAWGLDFGEVGEILLVPSHSGTEKGLISKWFGSKKGPANPPEEHPMALTMAEGLQDFIKEHSAMLNNPDDEGWLYLHRDALAGNSIIVAELLKAGADPYTRTPTGKDAFDLAKILDWENVTEVLMAHKG